MTIRIEKIGLIAGNGMFPILFARAAKAKGIRLVIAAVKGDTSIMVHWLSDTVQWFSPGELKKLFEYFRSEDVRHVLMAGQVHPRNLFDSNLQGDDEFRGIFDALQDRRCDTIFGAVAERLKAYGMELLDSTFLLQDFLAPHGTLTRTAPSVKQLEDIEFGCSMARAIGAADIGQTVIVKDKAVVAVEALEGTDQTIFRGGRIAQNGAVVVKTSKPKQDNRFDVPVVGPRTIQNMKRVKASCLAIEAGKTILIDRDKTIRIADQAGICIVSV